MEDQDQILIKIDNSPYYVVQPPLYDWNHPDTQARIAYETKLFHGQVNLNDIVPQSKLLEPWRYRLAAEYNKKYNEDNNIDPFAYLHASHDESSQDE